MSIGSSRSDLASIGARFGARLLDGIILMPLYVFDLLSRHPHTERVATATSTSDRLVFGHRPLWLAATIFLIPALYDIGFIALKGQTPGKMVTGVKVVMNDGSGDLPGLGASTVRLFVAAAGSLLGLVARPLALLGICDPLYALIDDRKRCVHDLAAGTVVVRARRAGRQPMARPDEPSFADIDLDALRRDPPLN